MQRQEQLKKKFHQSFQAPQVFKGIEKKEIIRIIFNFSNLYTFIKYCDDVILENIIQDNGTILVSQYQKERDLIPILQYINENYKSINLNRLTKIEIFKIICRYIKKKCHLSNFFIQDLFEPSRVFKKRYIDDAYTDIFITSFYYILNCEFEKDKIPLKTTNKTTNFMFPLDVDPVEFDRPCILIDVANQLNQQFIPTNITYQDRFNYLRRNIFDIMQKLVILHDDPNLLVFFVNQGDRNDRFNCPEIYSVERWDSRIKELLRGTKENPLDRKALYISVPCNLFLYPEIDYSGDFRMVEHEFHFNKGEEPGYPPPSYGNPPYSGYYQSMRNGMPALKYDQTIKNVMYDRYGRMLYMPDNNSDVGRFENRSFLNFNNRIMNAPVKIPFHSYKLVNSKSHRFKIPKKSDNHMIRHAKKAQIFQGKNKYEDYVMENSACAGYAIHKNEIDDYMIGILLCIRDKLVRECKDDNVPFQPQWLLFSADNFRWMKSRFLDNVWKQSNFIEYIHKVHESPLRLYQSNPKSKQIIQEIGLYPYTEEVSDFHQILKSIIRLHTTPSDI